MYKRKICVVITARPSYSRIKSTLQAILQHPRLELQIVLAGPALLEKYGNLNDVLTDDGFTITEKIYTMFDGDQATAMAKTAGIGIIELSGTFHKLQPHMVVVIADRFETISVSIAAAYQNIPLVHVQGGEITGSIDEKVRHANTKFADIHLVCNRLAKETVIKLGEDPGYVFNTGCPSIDIAAEVLQKPALDFNPYKKYGGTGLQPDYSKGYFVVMQHPVTTEVEEAKVQIEETLEAIKQLNVPTFWFSPNADAGSDVFTSTLQQYKNEQKLPMVQWFNNMKPADFLKLVYNAKCLIGNSSMGIRECAFMGVPVVNIGTRQSGRARGFNVMDVAYNKTEIIDAVVYWHMKRRPEQSFVYGKGDAGQKMAAILAGVALKHSKILQFPDEKPMHNPGPIRIERRTGQKYKTA